MTWQTRAACSHPSVQPGDFSPLDARGRVDLAAATRIADAICRRCPVRLDCLEAAVTSGAQEVVQGGMWFPAAPYRTTTSVPVDLLADTAHATEDAAA